VHLMGHHIPSTSHPLGLAIHPTFSMYPISLGIVSIHFPLKLHVL
jgi:hypothetical protein